MFLLYWHHGSTAAFLALERPKPQRRELLWSVSLELKRSAKLLALKLKKTLVGCQARILKPSYFKAM